MFQTADIVAILLLLGLFGCLVAWIVAAWRRIGHPFSLAFLYLVNVLFTRILWRTQVSGPLPVAPDQGAIIVCNHRSGIDPLLIQLSTDRLVQWMVAREYTDYRPIAWAFRILRSIPVGRGGVDTAATKMAIRLAQEGGLVGLFPEGRINLTSKLLLPGRPGAALIALKARVPVIPCYVSGSPYGGTALSSFLMPARARVAIGEPIDISEFYGQEGDRKVLEQMTKQFLAAIAELAGVKNFQAELAGKNWKPEEEAA
jgi:1-acyl-sn-glycerol-3-phosphate acyltransferase